MDCYYCYSSIGHINNAAKRHFCGRLELLLLLFLLLLSTTTSKPIKTVLMLLLILIMP